ncbi:MAG TPA: DUF86 domain-containing protein [Thermoanaerobaculia bacterium]|nr:DUF86 domain-containing protein [Thermoanaerobaculia bacterium]
MVQRDVAARKIANAAARLDAVGRILSRPRETFLAQPEARDLAAFYLLLAIQECIDLAAHWIADEGWLAPDDAASTFDVLSDHGVIDRSLASGMRAAVGLRHRIAHGYTTLDHGRMYDESDEGVATVRAFLAAAAEAVGL